MYIPIIMITHNNASTLDLSLYNIRRTRFDGALKIIIVDNASIDETRSIIRKHAQNDERIQAIFLPKNVGFPKGVIIGVLAARPEKYFAIINPDAIPTRDWLAKLVDAMEQCGECGMAQSLLVHPDLSIDSAGGLLNFLDYPIELRYVRGKVPYKVHYAKGAAALIRISAYRVAGGFDPRFFFYYDETDLCARMRKRGFKIIVVPNSVVFHVGQGSSIPGKEYFTLYYMERNRLLYMYKNDLAKLPLGMVTALLGIFKEKGIRKVIRVRALRDFLRLLRGEEINEPFRVLDVIISKHR